MVSDNNGKSLIPPAWEVSIATNVNSILGSSV